MALLVSPSDPGAARPARIAVTMVAAGAIVPWWENRLAARMTWPHHRPARYPLALPRSTTTGGSPAVRADPPAAPMQARRLPAPAA